MAISESEDQEIGELGVRICDITEGWLAFEAFAEGGPLAEDGVVSGSCLSGSRRGGELQSSAEVSLEFTSGGR